MRFSNPIIIFFFFFFPLTKYLLLFPGRMFIANMLYWTLYHIADDALPSCRTCPLCQRRMMTSAFFLGVKTKCLDGVSSSGCVCLVNDVKEREHNSFTTLLNERRGLTSLLARVSIGDPVIQYPSRIGMLILWPDWSEASHCISFK